MSSGSLASRANPGPSAAPPRGLGARQPPPRRPLAARRLRGARHRRRPAARGTCSASGGSAGPLCGSGRSRASAASSPEASPASGTARTCREPPAGPGGQRRAHRAVGAIEATSALTPSATRPAARLWRGHHHRHVAPFLHRALLDHAELGELLGQPVEDRRAALGVGHLAPAEHDRHLDLVLVAQEALDVVLLGVVVVLGDLRAELDLAHGDLLLVLARLLELLGLLVLVLGVVEHPAHRRARLGCDLDQVEVAFLGELRARRPSSAHRPACPRRRSGAPRARGCAR